MQFRVYLLRCSDGSYYAGHTDNPEARLWQHQQGICCGWTRRRRPVELVWCEAAPTREEALAFERRIKGWTRAKKEALIAGNWGRINWLARAPHERRPVADGTADPVRAERSAKRAVEARLAPASGQRPSTSLRTNEAVAHGTADPVRAERSAKRAVEARQAPTLEQRASTSLRTDEAGDRP